MQLENLLQLLILSLLILTRWLLLKTKVIDLPGPTRNGILYPIHEMKEAIERPRFKQQLATGSMYGEHDHPVLTQKI